MPSKVNPNRGVVVAATSDLHGILEGISETCRRYSPDILVIAGDIQPADIIHHCNDTACGKWFRNSFFAKVKSLKCEVVAIPGNHDFWLRSMLKGDFGTPEECRKKFFIPDNFHLLCDSEITIKGLRIYGTPWVPWISGHWCYEVNESELPPHFAAIPYNLDILIAHTPPYYPSSSIDISLERDINRVRHFGSPSLTKSIEDKSPFLVFCGHIHSGDHKCKLPSTNNQDHNTLIFNVSRVNERYTIGYPMTVVEIRDKTITETTKVGIE